VTTQDMPSPAAVLRACGWLTEGAGLARVQDLSSSHSVRRATRSDGAEAIIKHRRDGGRRGIASELFVYRLAGWSPELSRVLARSLHIDERAEILVLEALSGVIGHGLRLTDPGFMRRIGEALAIVHVATMGQPMPVSAAAGILQVPDHPDATGLDRPPQTRALMHRIAGDAVLADALRQAKAAYRARCLIHGDLRPEHWLEMPDGTLRLIDWEMGGGGDPMLDLASALIEPALDAIRAGAPARDWLARADRTIAELVAGYRAHGGSVFLDDDAERTHVVRLGAARLLHIACEWSDSGGLAASVDALFDCAKTLLHGVDAASERLAA
jgi:hypothetical protein